MYVLISRAICRINGLMVSGPVHHYFICKKKIYHFFEKIDLYLNDNGIVYLSGKNGFPTGETTNGRYFLEFTEGLVEKRLAVNDRMKLEELWYSEDVSGRKGFRWMNVILKMV